MKTFFITSHIYCRPRNFDASWISDYLVANGFSYTKDYSRADLVVINTCAFRKQEENSSLRVIRYYERRRAKGARLIILGCLPAINPNVIAGLRDYSVILPSNLHEIDKIVNGRIRLTSVPERHLLSGFQQAPILSLIDNIHRELCALWLSFRFSTDFFSSFASKPTGFARFIKYSYRKQLPSYEKSYCIVVARGCSGICSYCAIRFVIGGLRSKPVDVILEQFAHGLIQGHRRFLIMSEDIGSYGTDIGTTIAVLLQKIFSTPGDYKTSIRSMNPMWLVKYRDLSKILLANSDRIDYVTIPIQSGSSRILKLMNRYSNNERLKNLLKTLTPHINVHTMIIVGFPGETEKDFQATLDFVKEVKFAHILIFAYCDRPGTKASKMPHKIATRTIYHRIQRLQKAQQLFGTCQVKWS